VGATDAATLTLVNSGTTAAAAGLLVNMPAGFSASGFVNVCGGTLTNGTTATQLALASASVPANGSCKFRFTLQAPTVANLPPRGARSFAIVAAAGANLANLAGTDAPTVSFLGSTPGMYSDWYFPRSVTALSRLDMFITPMNDPGPHSNVFWSNQVNGLGGYTGMQTTELSSTTEGHGKQFLFSLWGATDARTGTPPSAGIGAGSFCTVSSTATDGSSGVQCRYRYEWVAGHTYRFRVTPNASLGAGWFTSNVTDVTAGSAGDSFDIGSIFVGASKPLIPASSLSIWTEYFDWNSERTSCLSVARAYAQMSVQAFDANGAAVTMPAPSAYANNTCSSTTATVSYSGGVVTELGEPAQSAQGFIKSSNQCLSLPSAGNTGATVLNACPSQAQVQASGGGQYWKQLWVLASDGSIQTENSYCLAASSSTSGSVINAANCAPGDPNQQWQVNGNAIALKNSGLCLSPSGSGLTLAPCASATAAWTVPGQSFSY
jgi:hypothetical protein